MMNKRRVFLGGLLLALAASLQPASAAGPEGSPGPWMEIQRGDVVREILWLERGGVLEYARVAGDQVLSHRRGLLPGQRFQQLLTGVETHGQAGPGAGPSYRAALHATGGPGELFLEEGAGGFGDALFRITAALPEGVRAGTYVRLGAETAGPPAGVSQSSTMNVGLGRELCRLPGRPSEA